MDTLDIGDSTLTYIEVYKVLVKDEYDREKKQVLSPHHLEKNNQPLKWKKSCIQLANRVPPAFCQPENPGMI